MSGTENHGRMVGYLRSALGPGVVSRVMDHPKPWALECIYLDCGKMMYQHAKNEKLFKNMNSSKEMRGYVW